MPGADIAIIAVILISGLISLWRGFIKEALSLVVWLAALFISISFREPMALVLAPYIEAPSLQIVVAFIILFVLTLIVGGLINHLIGHLVKASGLTGTDRFLGLIFGLARGVLVVLIVLMLLPKFIPVDQDQWWQQSLLIPYILTLESAVVELKDGIQSLVSGWLS